MSFTEHTLSKAIKQEAVREGNNIIGYRITFIPQEELEVKENANK